MAGTIGVEAEEGTRWETGQSMAGSRGWLVSVDIVESVVTARDMVRGKAEAEPVDMLPANGCGCLGSRSRTDLEPEHSWSLPGMARLQDCLWGG